MSEQNTERDTHFQGAAKLLIDRLVDNTDGYFLLMREVHKSHDWEEATRVTAQFLYDFKQHVMNHVDDYELEESYIPDMTELPE